MRRQIGTIALLFLAVSGTVFCRGTADDRIQVHERDGAYELTVPKSRLSMIIPKGGLVHKKQGAVGDPDSLRYFQFEDVANGVFVSGWFEPADKFQSVEDVWKGDVANLKQAGLPDPLEVTFAKLEGWNAVIYDMPLPRGTNSHIRAHWVDEGTWIDIHLSIVTERPSTEARSSLKSMLGAVRVSKK